MRVRKGTVQRKKLDGPYFPKATQTVREAAEFSANTPIKPECIGELVVCEYCRKYRVKPLAMFGLCGVCVYYCMGGMRKDKHV